MNGKELFNEGVRLIKLERYEDALKTFEKAIEIDTENVNAWVNKGIALGKLERYDDALKAFDKAIEMNSKYVRAWVNKGIVLNKLKWHEEAIKAFEKAIEINSKKARAWFKKDAAREMFCDYIIAELRPNKALPRPKFFRLAAPCMVFKKEYARYEVFYATDRNQIKNPKLTKRFGTDRGKISYGTCVVSIPRDHRMGKLESPTILRLEFRKDPKKHIVLLTIEPKEKDQYFNELTNRINARSGKNAFIFIHGYNTSFEDAAKRTAQISYDLGFDGAPVFYSWPSQGTFKDYPVDEANIEWTQTNMRRFLDDFVVRTDAENIYLIAHSMGCRVLTRSFGSLISDKSEIRKRFREIILTAPDIDADVFKRNIVPQIIKTNQSITLYASSKDKALIASKKFHGYPRAGDTSSGLVVMSGIDTIDASNVDTSFIGHSYYAEARSVLADIFYLIRDGKRPDQRFALEPVDTKDGRYWMFKK